MLRPQQYVPVIKWKRGEQAGVRQLGAGVKARLTPLVEIIPIPRDLDTDVQTRDLAQHVDPHLDALVSAWGTADPFFLDSEAVAGDSLNGIDGAEHVFTGAQTRGLQFIPVVGLASAPSELSAAKAHVTRGVCIRVYPDDFGSLPAALSTFVGTHGFPPDQVDLVIDLESVVGQTSFVVSAQASAVLQSLPTVGTWRSLVLCASAFPDSMASVTSGVSAVDRVEWNAWKTLHGQRAALPRLPNFGDYGIQAPSLMEGYDPRYMQMSAAIRYTLEDEWLIIKGQSTRRQSGKVQYPSLAQVLVNHARYYGPQHSPGCADAFACANGANGHGSPEAWRRIGTSHHLTVVTNQLALVTFP